MKKTKRSYPLITLIMTLLLMSRYSSAQSGSSPHLSVWDGMIVAGYVGHGGYANFGGPSIKWSLNPISVALGLFPTVRIKEDKVPDGGRKNAVITPSTGFGITASFRHLVLQIPVFYDTKTTARDGRWHLGLGIGYKF